eukprot:scaffold17764_cov33-Tisochrysis_lutea.AAC.1
MGVTTSRLGALDLDCAYRQPVPFLWLVQRAIEDVDIVEAAAGEMATAIDEDVGADRCGRV